MNACYALEPTSLKTRWQVLQRTNVQSDRVPGCAGLRKKDFVTLAVDICQGEKQERIAQMWVVARLVFNIALYLPTISRLKCLINMEMLQKFKI